MKQARALSNYYGLNPDGLAFNNAQFDKPNGEMKKFKGDPKGSKDWTDDVSPVTDQGTCSSSWAFMTTDIVASSYKI